ncbi:MAG: LysE family translocator [Proteocatella sp.]
MSFVVFLGFLQYFLLMSYTPGPANLYSMNVGMQYGMKTFYKVYAGLFTAFTLIVMAAAFLCYQFEKYIPTLTSVLTVLGIVYILWLSYQLYKSGKVEETEVHDKLTDFWSCFKIGFLLNMANVKVMIFCVSLFQLYLLNYYHTLPDLLLWCLPIAFFSSSSTFLWAVMGSRLSKVYNKHYRIINPVMSCMLAWCAVGLLP